MTVTVSLALALAGCAASPASPAMPASPAGPGSAGSPTATTGPPTSPSSAVGNPGIPSANSGRTAASQRTTFVPTRIRLLDSRGATARVNIVDTGSDGLLQLPADPGEVGWWASGALAGEAFGSVVLAGHIDSRARGVGFFAKLLDAGRGDRVDLSGDGVVQRYVVHSVTEVTKSTLNTAGDAFARAVPGRLVLITCTGRFDPVSRHYDRNLVVIAVPVGLPRRT